MTPAAEHIDELDRLYPSFGDTSRILISCHKSDYSASKIARAVEDADAHILNLNIVTAFRDMYKISDENDTDTISVDIRIDRADPTPTIRSLQRYGYNIENVSSAITNDSNTDSIRERINEILHYLEL